MLSPVNYIIKQMKSTLSVPDKWKKKGCHRNHFRQSGHKTGHVLRSTGRAAIISLMKLNLFLFYGSKTGKGVRNFHLC